MNEWSPGGNFSRPETPIQSGRSYRSQWEEPDKSIKPLIVNIRAVSDNKSRSCQQHSLENVTKSSMSVSGKTNRSGNGASDPRFKRVISNAFQSDACVGTEAALENNTSQPLEASIFNKETMKSKEGSILETADCENLGIGESDNQIQHHLKAVDKLAFTHDILTKSLSKESFSNRTVNTINTSLASEDLLDDVSNELSMFPSATRVKKVQHWMQYQKPRPDKKQSVVTVIGQTQEQDTLSSALREIDKRRKLVKELDKYAMCKKLIETDKGKEISDLVAKITSLSPSERRIKENRCDGVDGLNLVCSGLDGSGDTIEKEEEKKGKFAGVNNIATESSSPVTQKRPSSKRKTKKNHLSNDCPAKGKFQNFFDGAQYQWLFYVVFLISGILCWATFSSLHTGSYVPFDFFSQKPKTSTWYEKICMWLWEIFRPSGNYKRNSPWKSY